MNTADATLEENAQTAPARSGWRRYPHPVDRVWAALTEPEQLARWWLPFEDPEIEVDLVEGGAFEMRRTGDEPWSMTSTILRLDPPRLFEYTHADPGRSSAGSSSPKERARGSSSRTASRPRRRPRRSTTRPGSTRRWSGSTRCSTAGRSPGRGPASRSIAIDTLRGGVPDK